MDLLHVPSDRPTVPVYLFHKSDYIEIRGVELRYISSDAKGVWLNNPRIDLDQYFTHAEIGEFVRSQHFRHRRNFHNPASLAARMWNPDELLCMFPVREQQRALYREMLCKAFLIAENAGQVSRSDKSMKTALTGDLGNGVQALAVEMFAAKDGSSIVFKRPSPRTMRTYLRQYEHGGHCAYALLRRTDLSGNSTARFSQEVYKIMWDYVIGYAEESRPTKTTQYEKFSHAIDDLNIVRKEKGQSEFKIPTYKTFATKIDTLDKFFVDAGRLGIDFAVKKHKIVGHGFRVYRPGEMIQFDEHKVKLITFLETLGLADHITPEGRAAIKNKRIWICAAIDVATRCILGLRLTMAPNADVALDVLRQTFNDKSVFAQLVGAQTPWDMAVGGDEAVSDQGSAFLSIEFQAAASDLFQTVTVPRGGEPTTHPHIERFWQTMSNSLMPLFTGRTFSNVVERGTYDAEDRASLTVRELEYVIYRWVIDVYHHRRHGGLLGRESPYNAWQRLQAEYGIVPPPDKKLQRQVLGIGRKAAISIRGVRFLGIYYQSEELQLWLRKRGEAVVIMVDPSDLGVISVRLGETYIDIPSVDEMFQGISAHEWIDTTRQLDFKNAKIEAFWRPVIKAALDDIRKIDQTARQRAGHISREAMIQNIERAERHLQRFEMREIENTEYNLDGDEFCLIAPAPPIEPPSTTSSHEAKVQNDWSFDHDD